MEEVKDISAESNKLDFSKTFNKGNHMIEIYGAEGCCDETTRWSFRVNNCDWLDFTTENLNFYKYKTARCDMCS
jgi:hypothetical protein